MKVLPIAQQSAISVYENSRSKSPTSPLLGFSGDKIEISSSAASFSVALRELMTGMEQRSPHELVRHRQIAREIRSGSYYVPTQDITGKILQGTRLDAEV